MLPSVAVLGCALRMWPLVELLVEQSADLSHQRHETLRIFFHGRLLTERLPRQFVLTFHFPSGLLTS